MSPRKSPGAAIEDAPGSLPASVLESLAPIRSTTARRRRKASDFEDLDDVADLLLPLPGAAFDDPDAVATRGGVSKAELDALVIGPLEDICPTCHLIRHVPAGPSYCMHD